MRPPPDDPDKRCLQCHGQAHIAELNPAERVWLALKDALAWRTFDDVLALQEAVAVHVEGLEASTLQSLTAYPYLSPILHAQTP